MQQITIENIRVQYAVATGSHAKDAVLFIHGMWGGAWVWENYLSYFSEVGFDAYALDLQGHTFNTSTITPGNSTFATYYAEVEVVIRYILTKTGRRPVLVGHSAGNVLALKAATAKLARAVVGVAPMPPRGIRWPFSMSALWAGVKSYLRGFRSRALMVSKKDQLKLGLHRFEPQAQEDIYKNFLPESLRYGFEVVVRGILIEDAKIEVPALFITGRGDRTVLSALVYKIAQHFDRPFVALPRLAHMMPLEQGWEQGAWVITEWLRFVLPASE